MSVKTVMVIFGGVSTEHLISGRSAYNVIKGLKGANIEVITVGITRNGEWLPYQGDDEKILEGTWEEAASQKNIMISMPRSVRDWIVALAGKLPDCIFPAVHGINCEDGALQGLLQLSGIPYVGCHVLASAAGMDKCHSKIVFASAGIPQCRHIAVNRSDLKTRRAEIIAMIENELGYPCFLKPNQGGSSVGAKRASNREELESALDYTALFDTIVLVEEFVKAREVEVAVMGNEVPETAVIGEVATADHVDYYDYETKYFSDDGASVILPAPLEPEQESRIRDYAVKAWTALGCRGLSRIDFFLTAAGDIYINEINTMPGFTAISVFPQAFAKSGKPIEQLTSELCELAVAEYDTEKRQELI
ncbi:MAG: D-alanine--D-alanine ligase [Clostridiaceae bacterium]|nr:D-alanine--D-alanine ligase [Clostridiaceae bacterium]